MQRERLGKDIRSKAADNAVHETKQQAAAFSAGSLTRLMRPKFAVRGQGRHRMCACVDAVPENIH